MKPVNQPRPDEDPKAPLQFAALDLLGGANDAQALAVMTWLYEIANGREPEPRRGAPGLEKEPT